MSLPPLPFRSWKDDLAPPNGILVVALLFDRPDLRAFPS